MRIQRVLGVLFSVAVASASVMACGGGQDSKTAKVTAGEMPAGETWTGVYFHPVYGYLHMQEEDSNVVGRWERADKSAWGELSGTKSGNVLHFTWKEHKFGLVGPAADSHGKGVFVYKAPKEEKGSAELDGQFGLDNDETGQEWHNVKQQHVTPDLKSIPGRDESNVAPGELQ